MMDSSDTLRMAVKEVGVKRVAAALGVSTSLVYKWCERRTNADGSPGSGAENPLDRLATLVDVTGDDRPARWLAGAAGGFFARNPAARPAAELGMLRQIRVMIGEFADMLESVEESLADGKVEPDEAEKVRRDWEDLKSAGETLVVGCERQAEVPAAEDGADAGRGAGRRKTRK